MMSTEAVSLIGEKSLLCSMIFTLLKEEKSAPSHNSIDSLLSMTPIMMDLSQRLSVLD